MTTKIFHFCLFLLTVAVGLGGIRVSHVPAAEEVHLQTDSDGVQRAAIVMTSYAFSPSTLVVTAGVPVELTLQNESFLVPHNFVIINESLGLHHNVTVSAGDSVTVQLLLTTPGRYVFYCDKQLLFFPTHREQGMEGVIEVRQESSP